MIAPHEGRPPAPHDLWTAWSDDPAVWIGLALAAGLYARGTTRLWRRAGHGRGVRRWRAAAFWAGWLALATALASPLHGLAEALFSAHMAQHTLILALAAPLLVLGRPIVPALWALPPAWRRRLGAWARRPGVRHGWRTLTAPLAAWILHAAALWLWHAPALYQASLASDAVHALQHLSFLAAALLFWQAVAHGGQGPRGHGAAALAVFTTALHGGALGALVTFAPTPWYAAYAESTQPWGLTPLEDQQLAGILMWFPAGLAYTAAGLALVAAWLRESERRAQIAALPPR